MIRFAVIAGVALFAIAFAPTPDPRIRAALQARAPHQHSVDDSSESSFYCPMDLDVRSPKSGRCPRCGMELVQGVPDLVEYPLDLQMEPSTPRPDSDTRLTFALTHPRTHEPVRKFELVHEKLYHSFVVSEDLSFFLHAHPERQGDEDFHLDVRFPKPGMYRVLSDFYPTGGTPQLIASTIIVPGASVGSRVADLHEDLSPQRSSNALTELHFASKPQAGVRMPLRFLVTPSDKLEPYLGTWGHVLMASADLIDMIHSHPTATVDRPSGKELTFDLTFPRPGMHRVWLQFQRDGVVNTVAFNVPVE